MQNSQLGKILYQNRKHSWIGGDMVQLERTMEELKKLGLDVTFNNEPLFRPAILLGDYSIVHTFNFSMPWTKFQVWAAKRQGCKVVCSMIYHDTEVFIPYSDQQIMIDSLDKCIFLTEGEVIRARKHLTIPDEKVVIIPNGLDSWWLTEKCKRYKDKGYVLTVGRLDGSKGQLETAMACSNLGLKYLCVGERIDENYAKLCEAQGAIVMPHCTQKELLKYYDNAAVLVLASSSEIFPLVVMEAGARGLNSVVVDSCEWKDIPQVTWCKHGDGPSIQEAITEALKKPKNKEFQKLLTGMTWDNVGKKVLEVYNEII